MRLVKEKEQLSNGTYSNLTMRVTGSTPVGSPVGVSVAQLAEQRKTYRVIINKDGSSEKN